MAQELLDKNFQNSVDREIIALTNLVDRNFPLNKSKIRGWRELLLITLKTCKTTYSAIKYLVADSPTDPNRDIEFGLAISPLNRQMADLLFVLVFVRQRPAQYCRWYHQAGWREISELIDKYKTIRKVPPNWDEKINEMEDRKVYLQNHYKIPKQMVNDPKLIKYWPTPSQMKNRNYCNAKTYDFLEYLYIWIYRDLSQHSHFSGAGIIRTYSSLLLEEEQEREKALKKIKWNNFRVATTILISICTEVNHIGKYDRGNVLSFLWTLLIQDSGAAQDLFGKRYKLFLKNN